MNLRSLSQARRSMWPALLAAALLAACGDKKPGADPNYIVTLRYCSASSLSSCSASNQNGLADFPEDVRADIQLAADRMEKVIAAGLTPASASGLTCYAEPNTTKKVTLHEDVHGILVLVMVDALGSGGILAESGPCIVRTHGSLPLVAVMRFNSTGSHTVANLHASGQLTSVAFHELFHTLGFGTLWGPGRDFDLVTGSATDPRYLGAQALAHAKADNAAPSTWTSVPVDNTGMEGTAGSHWRQEVFSNWSTSSDPWELMTGTVPSTGAITPVLSATTLGAIADLGYAVDFSRAEPFDIPNPTAAAAVRAYALRAEDGSLSFGDDALHLPLEQADDAAPVE